MAHPKEHALQVDRDDAIERFFVIVLGRNDFALDAGVVEERVDPAIRRQRLLDIVLHGRRFRHIGLHERRRPAALGDDIDAGVAGVRIGVHHHHLGAPQREPQCRRPSDTAATAGDQCHLSGEVHFRFLLYRHGGAVGHLIHMARQMARTAQGHDERAARPRRVRRRTPTGKVAGSGRYSRSPSPPVASRSPPRYSRVRPAPNRCVRPASGVALRMLHGVRLSSIGWPMTSTSPSTLCGTVRVIPRCFTCGSANTSFIL